MNINKLFEVPHATASAMLKSPIFYPGDKIYFQLKISPEMRESMLKRKDIFCKLKSELTEIIHDMLKVRNRLFNCLDQTPISPICADSSKFNIREFGKMLQIIENDPIYSIFGCWNINRKSNDLNDDEICLSDEEQNQDQEPQTPQFETFQSKSN